MTKNLMKGKFKTLLKNFCLNSSFPGLKYFYLYPDWVSRSFWGVTLLLLYVFAGWLAVLLYSRFSDGPTRISIRNQHAPLTELPYPAITICSPNQVTIAAAADLNKSLVNGDRNIDLNENIPYLLGFYERAHYTRRNTTIYQHLQVIFHANHYTSRELMGLLPQSCDDFLKLCILQQERRNCQKLFRPLLTRHGLCCIFNSPYHYNDKRNVKDHIFEPLMATTLGQADALTVVIDYEPEKAVDYTVVAKGGVRVYFTDWSEFPADGVNEIVYPNAESFLIIHGTHTYCSDYVMELEPDSRNCTLEDEIDLIYFDKYRKSDCEYTCYVRNLLNECHCLPLYLPQMRGRENRVCNVSDIPCVMKVKSNIGGIFGLCLGFSIISIFEIMFYVSKAIRNHLTRRILGDR